MIKLKIITEIVTIISCASVVFIGLIMISIPSTNKEIVSACTKSGGVLVKSFYGNSPVCIDESAVLIRK